MFCTECGKTVGPGSKFCGSCGHEVSTAAPAPASEPIPVKRAEVVDNALRKPSLSRFRKSSLWLALLGGALLTWFLQMGTNYAREISAYIANFVVWTLILWAVIAICRRLLRRKH